VELFDFVVDLVLRFVADFAEAVFRFAAVDLRFTAAVVLRFAPAVFRFAAVVFRFAAADVLRFAPAVFRFAAVVFRFAAADVLRFAPAVLRLAAVFVLLVVFLRLVLLVLLAFVLLFACVFFLAPLFRDVLLVVVREPVVRVFVERDERRVALEPPPIGAGWPPSSPASSPPSPASSSSSPLPRSFFATTAAAGTARPIAVPATTLVGVESPCSSCSSFDMVASLGAPAVELGDSARR
jgi:hypothetical protein